MFELVLHDSTVNSVAFTMEFDTLEAARRLEYSILLARASAEESDGEVNEIDVWINDWSDQSK